MLLGAGRQRVEDVVDPAVGVIIKALPGVKIATGEALAEVHHRSTEHLHQALDLLQNAWKIGDAAPLATPLILGTIDG